MVCAAIFIAFIFVVYFGISNWSIQDKSNSLTSSVEIDYSDEALITKLNIPAYAKRYEWEEGQINIKEVFIPVRTILQYPELPQGCEIVALTAVLNSYGYDVKKTEMADVYLPKQPFTYKNNRRYGPNPYKAYAGNPRSEAGFFTYAPPIIEAANNYFAKAGGNGLPLDLSGSTREEIIDQLNKGNPVVIWVTRDLKSPKLSYSWYVDDTGEKFVAPINSHTVVLNGYDEKKVHYMDPLKGQISYDANAFFKNYQELGSHAMVVLQSNKKD